MATEELYREMTLEALADVDAGRVTDHEIVRAWIDYLVQMTDS